MTFSWLQIIFGIILVFSLTDIIRCAPSKPRQAGPCVGMDCLHGILMHGDDKPDKEHVHVIEDVKIGTPDVKTIDEHMHGVLMHADKKPGQDHADDHKIDKQIDESINKHILSNKKDGIENPHNLIHMDDKSKSEVRDFKELSENRITSWFGGLWKSLMGFFQSKEENIPVHDILDDMALVGNSGPVKDNHNHPEKHPRKEIEKHKKIAHTEN